MNVSDEMMAFWRAMHQRGDFGKIQKEYNVNERIVSDAIQNGFGSEHVISCINNFYLARKLRQDGQLQEIKKAIAS